MAQFDVHRNPVPAARRAYPWVVVMQSDVAASGRSRLVAPLAPRAAFASSPGRLAPVARFVDEEFVVLVPSLVSIPARDLESPAGSIAAQRAELLAAVDLLFYGV
jgi:toxin CcdB